MQADDIPHSVISRTARLNVEMRMPRDGHMFALVAVDEQGKALDGIHRTRRPNDTDLEVHTPSLTKKVCRCVLKPISMM